MEDKLNYQRDRLLPGLRKADRHNLDVVLAKDDGGLWYARYQGPFSDPEFVYDYNGDRIVALGKDEINALPHKEEMARRHEYALRMALLDQ